MASSELAEESKGQGIWVSNSGEAPILLCIEYWAHKFELLPGQNYFVSFAGPECNAPSVELSTDRITLYGWSGSTASVILDGKLMLAMDTPIPPMPA